MMRLLLASLIALFIPCGAASQHLRQHQEVPFSPLEQRRLGSAEFSIPVFAFTFRSPNILQGDLREDLDLLGSTVAGPLHDVVTEFVYESYRIQIARLANDASLPEMVRQLTMVDFDVTVVHSQRNKEEDHSLRNLQSEWFEFYAQFVGSAFFVEPVDPSTKPDNEYMEKLLGSWREQLMVEDFTVLKKMLHESEEPILQNLDYLVVLNDVALDVFPFKKDQPKPYEPNVPVGASIPTGSNANGNRAYKVLISLLVVVGTATLAAMLFLVRPYVSKPCSNYGAQQGAFPRVGDVSDVSLPGREEEIPVDPDTLEESDRWLQQHRPDLLRALQRTAFFRTGSTTATETGNGPDGIMNEAGRVKSNPLQYLYGGLFVRRNREPPLPSVSLASRDSQVMETIDFQEASPSWWQKLALSLQGEILACDEDPSQYDFAFSDFPRHDGTPCLIFRETETGPVLVRVSRQEAAGMSSLSNEDFKKQLSMHGQEDMNDSGVLLEKDVDPEFTSKLERLIAMRHRHYEKERIIQKGRKARDQGRRQAEARERQLKLRRHEMELDLEEIEASLTPRALSRKNLNAQPNLDTDMEKRKSHRVTLSDSDFFAAVDPANVPPVTKTTISSVEMRTIGGPSLRYDKEDDPFPPPRGSWHSRNLSDSSPRKEVVGQPYPLAAQPMKHRRSHRRSFSHGTQEMEEKVEHVGHKRNDSSAEDVMTFGIAAYTNFV